MPGPDEVLAAPAEDPSEIFRKHFEAQFKPLERGRSPQEPAVEEDETLSKDEEMTDWSGLSDEDEDGNVEVIDHSVWGNRENGMRSPAEMKAFMTSKPPTQAKSIPATKKEAESSDTEDVADAANLKKDLALQRLLRESHLLDNNGSLTPTGTNRHKALDMRLQSLGSKSSIYKQDKMPMSHRKGIVAKAAQQEEQRRKEAKENGIILERPKKKESKHNERRERGVGGPAVGKFRGGMLRLSEKDVTDIQGPKSKGGSFKKGKSRKR